MLTTLKIEGFRRFSKLEMTGLKRINLLVGQNNCGKSTVLEAVELLTRQTPGSLNDVAERRNRSKGSAIGLSSLFFGFEIEIGSQFSFSAETTSPSGTPRFAAEIMIPDGLKQRSLFEGEDPLFDPTVLRLSRSAGGRPLDLIIDIESGRILDVYQNDRMLRMTRRREKPTRGGFVQIGAETPSSEHVAKRLSRVLMRDEEEYVYGVLQAIEPSLKRLSILLDELQDTPRILAKLDNYARPVPLSLMGEGIYRMLNLATAIVHARGGVLLVDEIDTGLHYSTMTHLWKMLITAAERLDVQIFATTHSDDCWKALAQATKELDVQDASIQRISGNRSTAYAPKLFQAAADQDVEIR